MSIESIIYTFNFVICNLTLSYRFGIIHSIIMYDTEFIYFTHENDVYVIVLTLVVILFLLKGG